MFLTHPDPLLPLLGEAAATIPAQDAQGAAHQVLLFSSRGELGSPLAACGLDAALKPGNAGTEVF